MSKIEWTDRSDWNPIRGCTRVSPGCGGPGEHGGCYAEGMAARFSKPGMWGHGYAEMKSGKPRWTGKHLHRYLAEFDFRYNNRSALGVEDVARTGAALKGIVGKRLTYRWANRASGKEA
jgi:protein gp37